MSDDKKLINYVKFKAKLIFMSFFNLQDLETNEFVFYLKGADVVMLSKVLRNDWLEEEVGSLAKEGLRTLVVAKKTLTSDQYNEFEVKQFGKLDSETPFNDNPELNRITSNGQIIP